MQGEHELQQKLLVLDQCSQSEQDMHGLVRAFLLGRLPDSQRFAVDLEELREHWQQPARNRARAQGVIGGRHWPQLPPVQQDA